MATSHRDTHTRWEHLQVICAIYPDGTKIPVTQLDVVEKSHTGWKDAKYHQRQKSVEIGAPIVQAPQLSESDSPQVQKPLITDNNKGGSVLKSSKAHH